MTASGAYVLVFDLGEDERIIVGRLGTFDFQAGRYAYVGSAMNGLEARIRRHLRPEKRRRWHIDYLLDGAAVAMVVAVPGGAELECAISWRLAAHTGSRQPVPKFGSSDCRCRSHLHYWPPSMDSGQVAEMTLREPNSGDTGQGEAALTGRC